MRDLEFGELSGSAIESRFAKDILEVPAWIDGGAEPTTVRDGVFRAERLISMRTRQVDATVHGFRSAFRDWAGDVTGVPRKVAEAALAHVVGDATERAYRRGDAFDKRRELMRQWLAYCFDDGVEL